MRENYEGMRDNFVKNPNQFLANLLILSVQFFKNFDRWEQKKSLLVKVFRQKNVLYLGAAEQLN